MVSGERLKHKQQLINNKMKYNVIARSFERATGTPTADARDELIDTESNELFTMCKTILDIKNAYETFWNELNPSTKDVIFVLQVTPNA